MPFPAPGLYARVRTMLPEMMKFLVVGGLGTIIDIGGAALLHSAYHVEPLEAKAISVTLATLFTYLGSRFWTFKERENQSLRREAVLFFVLNGVGLLIAEVVLGLMVYVLALHGPIAYNVASLLGTGLGTIFRFYAYRKWVFLTPEAAAATAAPPTAPAFPDYPPWELDQAFFAAEPPARAPAAPVPSYASPWAPQPARRNHVPAMAQAGRGAPPAPAAQDIWGAPPAPAAQDGWGAPAAPAAQAGWGNPPAPAAPRHPAPAPSGTPRRSSGGGRHRKS